MPEQDLGSAVIAACQNKLLHGLTLDLLFPKSFCFVPGTVHTALIGGLHLFISFHKSVSWALDAPGSARSGMSCYLLAEGL